MEKCVYYEEIVDFQVIPGTENDFIPVVIEEHCNKYDCPANGEMCKSGIIDM